MPEGKFDINRIRDRKGCYISPKVWEMYKNNKVNNNLSTVHYLHVALKPILAWLDKRVGSCCAIPLIHL